MPLVTLGMRHQVLPVAQIAAASERTTGVPKHPNPPYIFECESEPTTRVPGKAKPGGFLVFHRLSSRSHISGQRNVDVDFRQTFFNHNLVANTSTRTVECNPLLAGEGFNSCSVEKTKLTHSDAPAYCARFSALLSWTLWSRARTS